MKISIPHNLWLWWSIWNIYFVQIGFHGNKASNLVAESYVAQAQSCYPKFIALWEVKIMWSVVHNIVILEKGIRIERHLAPLLTRTIASKLLLGKNNHLRRDAFWDNYCILGAWTIKKQILTLEVFCWLGSKPLSNSYQCTYELSLSYKLWSLSKDRKKKMLSHYDCCKECW